MEFFDPYLKDVGSLLSWLSKVETNITALQVVQAVAAILGIILSTLGIYKAWRYAEKRLGRRLEEFLENREHSLEIARTRLKEVRGEEPVPKFDTSALFSRRELKAVLRSLGKRFRAPAKAALEDAVIRTEQRGRLARRKEEVHLKEKSLAHLLLGAIADAEQKHQEALIHFQSALELDADDVEAMEYVGFQYLKLGNATEALAAFIKLVELAKDRRNSLLQAQALRYCGMAYEKLPTPRPRLANIAYGNAISVFPKDGSQVELALIYESRGLVSIDLGYRPQATECLMHALARFAEHERLQRRRRPENSGTARILAALKGLEQMADGAADGGGDGSSSSGNGSNGGTTSPSPSTTQQHPHDTPDSERPN